MRKVVRKDLEKFVLVCIESSRDFLQDKKLKNNLRNLYKK